MSYYPIFIELEGKKIIVVGGGKVAQRKINTFLEYHASVAIISEEITVQLRKYIDEGRIEFIGDRFSEDKLHDALLVVAATDSHEVNREISKAAKKNGILVNVVDQPSDCSFIVPSIVKRGDLVIGISTSGKSPAMAKKLRKEMEARFGNNYKIFLTLMGRLRDQILQQGLPNDERESIFNRLVDSSILEAIELEDWHSVAKELERVLKHQFTPDDVLNLIKLE